MAEQAYLIVHYEINGNLYPTGVAVSDAEMRAINMLRYEFHSGRNYIVSSDQQPPCSSNSPTDPNGRSI